MARSHAVSIVVLCTTNALTCRLPTLPQKLTTVHHNSPNWRSPSLHSTLYTTSAPNCRWSDLLQTVTAVHHKHIKLWMTKSPSDSHCSTPQIYQTVNDPVSFSHHCTPQTHQSVDDVVSFRQSLLHTTNTPNCQWPSLLQTVTAVHYKQTKLSMTQCRSVTALHHKHTKLSTTQSHSESHCCAPQTHQTVNNPVSFRKSLLCTPNTLNCQQPSLLQTVTALDYKQTKL